MKIQAVTSSASSLTDPSIQKGLMERLQVTCYQTTYISDESKFVKFHSYTKTGTVHETAKCLLQLLQKDMSTLKAKYEAADKYDCAKPLEIQPEDALGSSIANIFRCELSPYYDHTIGIKPLRVMDAVSSTLQSVTRGDFNDKVKHLSKLSKNFKHLNLTLCPDRY